MKVYELIAALESCNSDADIEIRGTVDEAFQIITDINVDNCSDELVVIDI